MYLTRTGSTLLIFEDVEVPAENMVGPENGAWSIIMSNFNPERLNIAAAAIRLARVCATDSYLYACRRETFGKPLIEHPHIRSKIAGFGLQIEPAQAMFDQICYIIESGRISGKPVNVGGMSALLKIVSTRCLEHVCREAQQIMGGAGYARTGPGARIEQISRDVRVHVVGGGSEEIMMDLAARQEIRDVKLRAAQSSSPKL